jgi:ubiquinone/menaquinone biosynthesis C-methylase UbiE
MFSESAEFYDAIYSFKDYSAEAARIAALVRSLHPGAHTILDVACGTGEHARFLAADHGFEVDGLDLDAGLLHIAREKHPSGRFFQADMSEFALESRYDVVLCLFSSIGYLVSLERTRRALECFRQHLRQDGVLLVFTTQEMATAFDGAGLRATFDAVGLTGRGLWVARVMA